METDSRMGKSITGKKVKVLDTTMRDGEQTEGVNFCPEVKLELAKKLFMLGADAVEVASARMSRDDHDAVKRIVRAQGADGVEILGFVDGKKSVDWAKSAGCRTMNLLTKGSLKHLKGQLGQSPKEHCRTIKQVLNYAANKDVAVNAYLEDWSNGMKDSPGYVLELGAFLLDSGARRLMLCDTLGALDPVSTTVFVRKMRHEFPQAVLDFHGHNDYSLAVANTLAAANAGAARVHVTMNGLGERSGNADLASVVACLHDHAGLRTGIKEKRICNLSTLVELMSGVQLSPLSPVAGMYAFTQNCGVHADGDSKDMQLYRSRLQAGRFGREYRYSLGKTSGAKTIKQIERMLQKRFRLSEQQKKELLSRVKKMPYHITQEELPMLVDDVKGTLRKHPVQIVDFVSMSSYGRNPSAYVKLKLAGRMAEAMGTGDGQYNAFWNALRTIYEGRSRTLPSLVDYRVVARKGAQALVHTTITWQKGGEYYRTVGADTDQLMAAVRATMKMLDVEERGK